jgi:hypothetical protein
MRASNAWMRIDSRVSGTVAEGGGVLRYADDDFAVGAADAMRLQQTLLGGFERILLGVRDLLA